MAFPSCYFSFCVLISLCERLDSFDLLTNFGYRFPHVLSHLKVVEKHPFTFSHYWLKLKDFLKWKDSFKLWYKDGKWTADDA
jgi:hypothetical protein